MDSLVELDGFSFRESGLNDAIRMQIKKKYGQKLGLDQRLEELERQLTKIK
jgi:hypothetical protein